MPGTLPLRTPPATCERLYQAARDQGLRYVYVGNVSRPGGHPAESTYCPKCGTTVVHRIRYLVRAVRIQGGKCAKCGTRIPGVWDGVWSKG